MHSSLRNHEAGTFLIRFSERWPGQFAIGYVGVGGEIKHYLVEEKDLTGKKSLPEFLEECDQFSTLLQVCCSMRSSYDTNDEPVRRFQWK